MTYYRTYHTAPKGHTIVTKMLSARTVTPAMYTELLQTTTPLYWLGTYHARSSIPPTTIHRQYLEGYEAGLGLGVNLCLSWGGKTTPLSELSAAFFRDVAAGNIRPTVCLPANLTNPEGDNA